MPYAIRYGIYGTDGDASLVRGAELIRRAAAARGESVTSFVVQAATRAAEEEELVIERETLIPADFFDSLIAALDAPDEVPSALHELTSHPRYFIRR